MFEEEKKFDSRTSIFLENTPVLGVFNFGQGEDFKLTTELSQKVHYSYNQAIKNDVNEAILLNM